jgi:GTP-binding protein EngB required for normal cell division
MTETFTKESLNQILNELQRKYDDLKNAQVKIAITGQSGNGKSSMINGLLGRKAAKVGATETTFEIKEYSHNGTILYDLPGCGTPNFPIETYIEKCNLNAYDAAIIVTANRFMENDLWLINEMGRLNKPVYVVRTKMDEATTNEQRDNDLTELEVFQKVLLDLETNLKDVVTKGIYLISSVYPQKWDFNKLFLDIGNNLDELKRKRFYADVALISTEVLEEKRKLAIGIISLRSWLAAANGINPIPGLDIAADIGLLNNLSKEIQELYGLDDSSLIMLNKRIGGSSKASAIKIGIANFSSKFVLKEGIALLLKKLAPRIATKEIAKFIPFIGQAAAAGIGYKLTHNFGEELIVDANQIANEILTAGAESIGGN